MDTLASSLFRPRRNTSVFDGVFLLAFFIGRLPPNWALATERIVFDNSGMTASSSSAHNNSSLGNSSLGNSSLWNLDDTTAILKVSQLSARVDLLNPRAGLHQLEVGGASLEGSVLGVRPGTDLVLPEELQEVFVRGNDLVVTYAETDARPFSVQVYWRATVGDAGVVMLDTILSLQTDLLESFPGIASETNLPAASTWVVSDETASELAAVEEKPVSLGSEDSDCLLLRAAEGGWSYAEMTYPEDRGEVEITRTADGVYALRRQLGGAFLEKGVIRCLRVRGLFLPQEEDVQRAADCFASLANEQPPLTV